MKRTILIAALVLLVGASAGHAVNSLSVINNPVAVDNTSGKTLSINLDGSNTNVYVETQHPNNEKHYRLRFWVNPHTVNLDANKSIRLGALNGQDPAGGQHTIIFLKRNDADSSWRINTWYKTDTNPFVAGPGVFIVSQAAQNQWRQVEIDWKAATAPGANNGQVRIQRTAPTTSSVTGPQNLDNDTHEVDDSRYGCIAGSGVNANSGAVLFDEFESYR
jgi:hypothetical protein